MSESLSLRFLYRTAPGRELLKLLVMPSVSDAAAKYMASPLSHWMIGYYRKKYRISLDGCEKHAFASFNEFFMRKKHLDIRTDDRAVISPCDGFLSIYQIDEKLRMRIKHSTYTVGGLLEDTDLARQFAGGLCCIFRLEPQHYHHYLYAVSGRIRQQKRIPGVLHCVRPIACEQFPVYVRNSREYTLLEHPVLGRIVQMEIGAMLVGKICNEPGTGTAVQGAEKGHFEYGGSTIVLLLQKDAAQLLPRFRRFLDTGRELPIAIGQAFAATAKTN